jgi:hypothetical protein
MHYDHFPKLPSWLWGSAVGLCAITLALTAVAAGQKGSQAPAKIDPKAQRQETEAALIVFLNAKEDKQKRLAAGEKITRVPPGAEKELLAIVNNRREDSRIRELALRKLPAYFPGQAHALEEILAHREDGDPAFRLACTNRLKVIDGFAQGGAAGQWDPSATQGLRNALYDPDAKVRASAMEYLAVKKDDVALRLLDQILDKPGLFTTAEAIRYLAADDPREHLAKIRRFLKSDQPEVRAAAVTVLGADLNSRKDIKQLLKDPGEPADTKVNAIQTLSVHDKQFPRYIVDDVIVNKDQDTRVRVWAVESLGRMFPRSDWYSAADREEARKKIEAFSQDRDPLQAQVVSACRRFLKQVGKGGGDSNR